MAGAFTLIAGLSALSALILIAMTFVFAQLIGWRALVRRYGGPSGHGTRYSSNGVLIGAHSWNAPPLIVAIDDAGIALLPKQPFRFAFGPLQIAWSSISSFEARSFAFFEAIELRFGNDGTSLISFVPSKATEAIASHLASRHDLARGRVEPAPYSPATE